MSKTSQFLPADGWCYLHLDDEENSMAIFDVVLWKVQSDGLVVGLISASIAQTEENIACLTTPPPVGGKYFLKGSLANPREWPTPPKILGPYLPKFGVPK